MKKALPYTVLLLLICFCFGCRKEKEDTTSPSISIFNPGTAQPFNMFDTILVSARVSDETQLTSVIVTLTDANNAVLQYSYSVPIPSKDFTFNIQYYLTEHHLPSGFYYISLLANDGSNSTQSTRQIHITESPTLKTGYFLVKAGQPKTVVRTDANLVQQNTIALQTGFNGMAYGAYYQQLYVNGNTNQPFIAYDCVMNGMTWNIPDGGTGLPFFSCVSTDGKKAYVGYHSGEVGSMTYTGNQSTGYSNGSTILYPYYFTLTTNYGIGIYKDKTGGTDKILSFQRSSGTPLNNNFMSIQVVGVYERTQNELYILGNNTSGQGVFYLYNVPTNGLSGPYSLPAGKLLSSTWADSDFLILAMDNGSIYGYRFSNSQITVLASVKAQKIVYNGAMKELNAAVGNQVYSYSLSSNYTLTQLGVLSASDSLIGFEVITNK